MEKLKEKESGSPEEILTQREKKYQEEIKKLTHELAGERKTIGELRNFIDVLRIGWSSDKKKLLKATEKLNEIEISSIENKTKLENDNFKENEKFTSKDCCIKMKIGSDSEKKIYKADESDDAIAIDLDPLRKTDKALIRCPLCCNDSFPSQETLKFHLLDVFQTIFCSICTKQYSDIISLASHLEDGCDGSSTFQPENKSEQDIDDIEFEAFDVNNIKQEEEEEEEESLEDFKDIQFEASHPVIDISDKEQEEELYVEDLQEEEEIDLLSFVEVIEEKEDVTHHNQGLLESSLHDGYWIRRGNHYKFINNEEKMKLLYPSFVPSKSKIKSSEFTCSKKLQIRSLKLIDKLEFIQIVDDKWLPSVPLHHQIQSNIIIYIVDQKKVWDKNNLGPIAKKISKLNCLKIKNAESDDALEVCNSKSKTYNLFCDESNTEKHLIPFIQVLKVSLGSDEEITIENIDFGDLPAFPDSIVPFLDNVAHPVIPLLEGAKQLKWHCKFCLTSFSTVYFVFRTHTCYQCKYCKKGFRKNMPIFMSHLLQCAKNNASAASPYACSSCPSFFQTLEEARKHIPLHVSPSKAVQCHLCYCFFSDKTVLNNHLRGDHNTDFTSPFTDFPSPQKSARLPANSSTFSVRNINNTCELDSIYQHDTKQLYKTDETLPVVEIKVKKIVEETLSRSSSRKRKRNQTYTDEYFVN